MGSPSFARYAALLAGVLDTSGAHGGCADVPAGDAADGREAERLTLDLATRRVACALRRPAPAPPRARPSAVDATYRERAAVPPASPDARLDRRG